MSDYDLQTLKFLVVDNNRNMHAIIKVILNAMRIKHIRYYDDAANALQEIREWMPDIIITDWKMDPLDGLDFVRQIRGAVDTVIRCEP